MHDARTHTPSAHDLRIHSLRQRFAAAGIDALLVTQLPNVFYLSGFTGTTGCLLLTPSTQHFITDFRYHERFRDEVLGAAQAVSPPRPAEDAGQDGKPARPQWQLADNSGRKLVVVLEDLLAGHTAIRLGIEAEHLTLEQHALLAASTTWQVVQTTRLVEELRMVKDEAELATLHRAAAIGAQVFAELLPLLSPRSTEADIAAEIEYRARKHGASACSFKPIIASGARSALPHAGFTTALLQPATPLLIDMGVIIDGYCSDMTRTVFLGDCPAQWRELYELVDHARDSAQVALLPGVSGIAADAVARDIIAAAGYGAQFGHGLGHGVGIQIHEAPRLTSASPELLAAGHVVTCEPGIYLPGQGGIRIENLCAITASGAENLTPLGTELLVI